MPGYRELPDSTSGVIADSTREAALLEQSGDRVSAVTRYEEVLAAVIEMETPLPGFLCGRLAALYRRLARYDDEVDLLEQYRDSQIADDARTRFDARLSKARAIQDKMRRNDSGALVSVRNIKRRS